MCISNRLLARKQPNLITTRKNEEYLIRHLHMLLRHIGHDINMKECYGILKDIENPNILRFSSISRTSVHTVVENATPSNS